MCSQQTQPKHNTTAATLLANEPGRRRFPRPTGVGRDKAYQDSTSRTLSTAVGAMLSTTSMKKKELSDEELADIQECFDLFDTKRSGTIDYHEFKIAMRALGFNMKKPEIISLIREYDRSGRGRVDFDTFLAIAMRKTLNRNPLEEILKTFDLFDVDKKGKISVDDLKSIAENLGETLPEEEIQAMIEEFDRDLDGHLNFAEFKYIMMQAF